MHQQLAFHAHKYTDTVPHFQFSSTRSELSLTKKLGILFLYQIQLHEFSKRKCIIMTKFMWDCIQIKRLIK